MCELWMKRVHALPYIWYVVTIELVILPIIWLTFWMSSLGFEVPVPLRLCVASISRPNMATSSILVYFLYSLHINIWSRSCGDMLIICSIPWNLDDVFPSFATHSPGLRNSSAVCFEFLYVCWSLLWWNESFPRNCEVSKSIYSVGLSWDLSRDKSMLVCCLSSFLWLNSSTSHGFRPFNWFCVPVCSEDELWEAAQVDIFSCWCLVFSNDIVTSSGLESSCVLVTDPANTVNYTDYYSRINPESVILWFAFIVIIKDVQNNTILINMKPN